MDIERFKRMPDGEKAALLIGKGTLAGRRLEEGKLVNLYALEAFYAEIWFNPENVQIERIRLVEDQATIDLYLDEILNKRK